MGGIVDFSVKFLTRFDIFSIFDFANSLLRSGKNLFIKKFKEYKSLAYTYTTVSFGET